MSAVPRPGLREFAPYVSPQLHVAARLNTNECPYPLPESFSNDLAERVASMTLNRYPDGEMTELRGGLAERTGRRFEEVWTANGSNEILTQLLLAYGGPGRRAIVLEPTYSLHSRISWLTHTTVKQIALEPPFAIEPNHIDDALAGEPDIVFVCSPNNPTGTLRSWDSIARVARKSQALILVDEAYAEFAETTTIPLIDTNPNLVVIRTLSKAFALAGARVGYCVAAPDVIQDLKRVRLPYNMSSLNQAAGLTALEHADEAEAILDGARLQRDRIYAALKAIPSLQVWPSAANFVLFRTPPELPAEEVWAKLLDRGVLVRDMSAAVPGSLRVTAGTAEEVDMFLEALGGAL